MRVSPRRTVFKMLKQQPDAIIDIHRDSAPPRAYYTEINSIPTARVMLVVGRQNPHKRTNLKFARQIKAKADQLYPGLVRGIFIARGNYNQDLYPTSVLIELGSDTLPRDMADNSARVFADVLTVVLKDRQSPP